jgi:ribosomal protein S18 acetylase RimI-like enzyme
MRTFERTWEFQMTVQNRACTRSEPFPWGTAIFNMDVPRVYDQNLLRVERGFDELSVAALEQEAERLQGPAGLLHRKVVLPDEDAGERLSRAFAERSWRRARHVVMAHRGAAPGEPLHPVRETRAPALRDARRRAFARDLGSSAATQVTAALELVARVVASSRAFVVESRGEVMSWCMLYEEGGVGEIDDVVTAVEHRRRGYGRAVVEAATRASLAAGNELTFLVADDDDWPKDLYERLGFEPIGRRYEFTRI